MRPALYLLALFGARTAAAAQTKLALSPANVIDAYGNDPYLPSTPRNMLDEQALAGDPAAGQPGVPKVAWESAYDPAYYGAQQAPFFFIDLNATFALTSVWVYRSYGALNISVIAGADGFSPSSAAAAWNWTTGHSIPSGVGWWAQTFSVPVSARYLTFTAGGPTGGSTFLELVLYGAQTAPPPPPPAPVRMPPVPLKMLLGANGFVWTSVENASAVGNLREYQDWEWSEHAANLSAFEPVENGFMLDDFYANMSAAGVPLHQCSQGSPLWMHGGNKSHQGWKPLTDAQLATPGASLLPASYAASADHLFQVAARYGRATVPSNMLKLAPGQPAKTGLGLLAWIEPGNEVDGTWNGGRNGFFASTEYAALLSAAFDGHGGTMGPGMGARAADPAIKVATSGLAMVAGLNNTGYFEAMRLWAAAHRPRGDFPAHALNVHHYSQDAAKSVGVSPEDGDLAGRLGALCAYRDAALPGVEVWLSEFGYDTVGGSQRAPPIAHLPPQFVQGAWLLRSVLAIARAGGGCVQRAHMYMMADVDSKAAGRYASSGLIADGSYLGAPKQSWFHYSAMTSWLSEHVFVGDVAVPGGAMATCFRTPAGGFALVAWSPTSAAIELPGTALPIAGAACPVAAAGAAVQVVVPQAPLPRGNVTAAAAGADGTLVLTVTEMPTLVLPAAARPRA